MDGHAIKMSTLDEHSSQFKSKLDWQHVLQKRAVAEWMKHDEKIAIVHKNGFWKNENTISQEYRCEPNRFRGTKMQNQ